MPAGHVVHEGVAAVLRQERIRSEQRVGHSGRAAAGLENARQVSFAIEMTWR